MENKYFCPKCRLWTDYDVRPISILFVIVCRACKSEYPALFQQQIRQYEDPHVRDSASPWNVQVRLSHHS